MQVHQVECNSTLQVPLDSIDRYLTTDIQDSTETDFRLRDSLIHRFVCCYTFPEIGLGFGFRHACVVWIARLDFERDVGSDEGGVVAVRF